MILLRVLFRQSQACIQSYWIRHAGTRELMGYRWGIVVAIEMTLLLVVALGIHAAFVRHPVSHERFVFVSRLFPSVVLSAVLMATAIALDGAAIHTDLAMVGLGFLADFLFNCSLFWFGLLLLVSLITKHTSSEAKGYDKLSS